MIGWLCQEYEIIFENGSGKMSVSRENIYEYLGMTLDYTVHGQVSITIISYIEDILAAFDKAEPESNSTKLSARPNNIFMINEDCKELNPRKVREIHNLAANNLYVTNQARMHTCTAIFFYNKSACAQRGQSDQANPFDAIHQKRVYTSADFQCHWR